MSVNLFDTHCHLDLAPIGSEVEAVITAARRAGVNQMLIPACGRHNWQAVAAIAAAHQGVYYALGMHPYFSDRHRPGDLELLDEQLARRSPDCLAVGECGLDFYAGSESEASQCALLLAQLELANRYTLPVILHCRKAHQQLVRVLKHCRPQAGGVLHGFSGSYQQAMDYIRLGLHIGVGGTITYPRANKTRQAIARLPLSSLVLETDAPDMPLSGFQGQPNRPAQLPLVLNALNLLRSEGEQTIAKVLYVNSKRLLQI